MTQGAFDLYWISVDPNFQGRGIGSKLLNFLEEVVREKGGRMVLAPLPYLNMKRRKIFTFRMGFRRWR